MWITVLALLLTACSDRWTLWRTVGGEASAVESGLDRLTCETLRDRHERRVREQLALLASLERQVVALGGQTDASPVLAESYQCRRD